MKTFLIIFQIILSVSLVILILTQSKGVGLGRSFSGSSDFYKSRRGVEKLVFRATVIATALFLVTSVFNLFV
ncbi:preprotein translocase subunit SecG [Candidatus Gottesmanbacteria bacterium RIFCSPHIGHO2_02_FULL_39_11]|uniref:Protein-export membrane protein SecG n=1 Tax=Candidatus Gottesmanbacteria bacterium RIFCSPHIGHO2_02_FULL_39_11 TaxID=1798382 RepID=A0A1F5ZYF4_9BACT|nr:MAG: preprotein translocase subunit SecG [Candidatus Gottesmanbacteria bacterium RIFCSPHIGHO2_02_FULL_39_11]